MYRLFLHQLLLIRDSCLNNNLFQLLFLYKSTPQSYLCISSLDVPSISSTTLNNSSNSNHTSFSTDSNYFPSQSSYVTSSSSSSVLSTSAAFPSDNENQQSHYNYNTSIDDQAMIDSPATFQTENNNRSSTGDANLFQDQGEGKIDLLLKLVLSQPLTICMVIIMFNIIQKYPIGRKLHGRYLLQRRATSIICIVPFRYNRV